MYDTTPGIVLNTVQYSDKTSIVHVYTRMYGRQSYQLPQRAGKRGGRLRPLFVPLSILHLEVEHLPHRSIQHIVEAQTAIPLTQLHYDPIKNAITLFLTEVMSRILTEPEPNGPLFDFIGNSIQLLDHAQEGKANFHIAYLIQLTHYLGISPNARNYQMGYYFDIANGVFTASPTSITAADSAQLVQLLRIDYANMHRYRFSRDDRGRILALIMTYYATHHLPVERIRSLEVLEMLFS